MLLFTLLFGILQFGMWFWAWQAGGHAAREAARVAAVNPCDSAKVTDAGQKPLDGAPVSGPPSRSARRPMSGSATRSPSGSSSRPSTSGFFPGFDGIVDKSATSRVENVPPGGADVLTTASPAGTPATSEVPSPSWSPSSPWSCSQLGAMAVDIGQAYAKKSLLQTDVDLAVMAATAELTSGGDCNPEVVAKATEFLNKADNAVPGQYTVDLGGSPTDQDGYIHCHDWRVDLYAPKSHVDFGLARP